MGIGTARIYSTFTGLQRFDDDGPAGTIDPSRCQHQRLGNATSSIRNRKAERGDLWGHLTGGINERFMFQRGEVFPLPLHIKERPRHREWMAPHSRRNDL